jgi:hypothetical protein
METEESILSRKFLLCEVRTSHQPQLGQRGLDFNADGDFHTCDPKSGEDRVEPLIPTGMFHCGHLRDLQERSGTLTSSDPRTGTTQLRPTAFPLFFIHPEREEPEAWSHGRFRRLSMRRRCCASSRAPALAVLKVVICSTPGRVFQIANKRSGGHTAASWASSFWLVEDSKRVVVEPPPPLGWRTR